MQLVYHIQGHVRCLEILLHDLHGFVLNIRKHVCCAILQRQKVRLPDAVFAVENSVFRPLLIGKTVSSTRVLQVVYGCAMAHRACAIRVPGVN